MNFGIIGTAGRHLDKFKLNKHVFELMCSTARIVNSKFAPDKLVSGGAAWADYIAIVLYNECACRELTLHFPCDWNFKKKEFVDTGKSDYRTNPGGTANYYHRVFQQVTGINSLLETQKAIDNGSEVIVTRGFKERNTKVAMESDLLLAITFGNKNIVKDGGTADTVKKFLKKEGAKRGYHFDLNTEILYDDLSIKETWVAKSNNAHFVD
jgi:hypothetical protein